MAVTVREVRHVEGEDLVLLARPEGGSATLTQSEFTSGTLEVFDPDGDTPDTALLTRTLTVANEPGDAGATATDCMFAALQEDSLWPLKGGYTFWNAVKDSALHLDGGKVYRVEVSLTMGHSGSPPPWPKRSDYGALLFIWHVTVVPTASA